MKVDFLYAAGQKKVCSVILQSGTRCNQSCLLQAERVASGEVEI